MTKILVTGASGHVGAHLVRRLIDQGHSVRALVRKTVKTLQGLDIELVYGDITDPSSLDAAFEGVEVVYHTAAFISISWSDWKKLTEINTHGTQNVLDMCRKHGVKRLVYVSSSEALTDTPHTSPVDENRPLVSALKYPPYARSKAASVLRVRQAVADGLDAVVVYPSAILGPQHNGLGFPNKFISQLANGTLFALTYGAYSWTDVRDVVSGVIAAAEKAPAGREYLLSGNTATAIEIADIVEEITGRPKPSLVFPMWLARVGVPFIMVWSRITKTEPLYTKAALFPLRANPHFDHSRAKAELGYTPRPLKDTIRDTIEWFGAHNAE